MNRRRFLRWLGLGSATVMAPYSLAFPMRQDRPQLTIQRLAQPCQDVMDAQTGIAIRYVRHYEIVTDHWPTRLQCVVPASLCAP